MTLFNDKKNKNDTKDKSVIDPAANEPPAVTADLPGGPTPTPVVEPKSATDIAESTHAPGEQTVDRPEDKVLPSSEPDEIAPVPDASGAAPRAARLAASETGYRVTPGKSISAITGDLIDGGQEIGPQHVAGGEERLEAFVKTGHVTKVDKK